MDKYRASVAGLIFTPALASLLLVTSAEAQSLGDVIGVFGGRSKRPPEEQQSRRDGGSDVAGGIGCAVGAAAAGVFIKGTVGKLLGGAALCAIGWKIGKHLTMRDKEKLTERSTELINEDGPRSETFVAPESKEQIQLNVSAPEPGQASVPIAYDEGVAAPTNGIKVEAKTYIVSVPRLNYRSSPSAADGGNIIGFFDAGENVEVLGRTPDGKWAMLGDGGVLIGYALFRDKNIEALRDPNAAAPIASLKKRTVVHARPKVIRKVNGSAAPAVATRDPKTATVKTAKVTAATQCKALVAQTGDKMQKLNGCALPNGQWSLA